jgi:cytidylate kinase
MIVTIDGPAGSGKSTAARGLAARLGFRFLDTGAMYRVVALKCLAAGVELNDKPAAARVAEGVEIRFDGDRVWADGVDVTAEIRTPRVTHAASIVAQNADVRQAMDRQQRRLAFGQDTVTEGRDQGTVVFPNADCKFFLVADTQERAARRQQEMQAQGRHVSLEELLAQIEERDRRDASRTVAPLIPAADAVQIDTSGTSIDDVLDLLETTVRDRLAAPNRRQSDQ